MGFTDVMAQELFVVVRVRNYGFGPSALVHRGVGEAPKGSCLDFVVVLPVSGKIRFD